MKYNISYLISLLIIYLFQINNVNAFQEASTPKVVTDSGVDSLYIYINLKDLKDVEVKNNYFGARMWYEISSNKTLKEDDYTSIKMNHTNDDRINEFGDFTVEDSIAYKSLYARFDHNWNLQNYPFDKQELKIKFKSDYDSVYVKIFPASGKFYDIGNLDQLKQGFKVDTITINKNYEIVPNDPLFAFNEKGEKVKERDKIVEELSFNIMLGRDGSWLYLKLFVGAIAAFIISWMVFLISSNDFNSRIELSVGAIFGAIGNRTYVESIIPDVQILTKADIINNFIILMIVFNILLIIIQRNNNITWKAFEDNRNAAIYSLYLLISINLFILFWPAELFGLQFILICSALALFGYFTIILLSKN